MTIAMWKSFCSNEHRACQNNRSITQKSRRNTIENHANRDCQNLNLIPARRETLKCNRCGKDAYLGFQCTRCGGYFCARDRLPENHGCAFKSMRSEEVSFRMQLERGSEPRPAQLTPNNEIPTNDSRFYRDGGESRSYDDEEDYSDRSPVRGEAAGRLDLTSSLLIFVVFTIIDLMTFFIIPIVLMLLPLIVHGVFLPYLYSIANKQKRGELPPRNILTFIQLIIAYMVIYMGVEIVVAFALGNFLTVGIFLFIGFSMVFTWLGVLQQIRSRIDDY